MTPPSSFEGKPAADEVELTLVGPGYGECVLVHVGAGSWMVVDCCETSPREPLPAVAYLDGIGVPRDAVKWVVATHWHDDHVRRFDELVEAFPAARIAVSSAFLQDELLEGVLAAEKRADRLGTTRPPGGVRAMAKVFKAHGRSGRLKSFGEGQDLPFVLPDGSNVLVKVLAPTGASELDALRDIGRSLAAALDGDRVRVPAPRRNDAAVVLWVEAGRQPPNLNAGPDSVAPQPPSVAVLLGADLEVRADPLKGWKGVVGSAWRRPVKATAVKVAHHGSANGHHGPAWSTMTREAVAVLTPWNRNRGLPQRAGVALIKQHASKVLVTADVPYGWDRIVGRRRRTRGATSGRVTLRALLPDGGRQHQAKDWREHLQPPAHEI